MSEFIINIESNDDELFTNIANMYSEVTSFGEEITRCRDCEFFDTRKCKSQWPFNLDAYCWWGKRKEGE